MWRDYPPQFPLRMLPAPMYQAHMSILAGKNIREQEQQEKSEKQSQKIQNKTSKYRGV